ncbi:unnamed protein product [Blepharisma stoltei]|uniref:RING-type domain-containing protein n=1 Tax=Blepharisma stoltei TaxID=1481888 RepID=A0AAU9IH54_9CILI|nr:unnamed protein product [Blepharisma stoltei]
MLKGILLFFFLYHFSFSLYSLSIDQSLEVSQDTLWNYVELNTTNIQKQYISINLLIKRRQFQSFPLLTLNFDHFPEFSNENISSVNSNYSDFYSYENQISQHSIILKAESLMYGQNAYVGVAYPNNQNGLIKYKLTFTQSDDYICSSDCSGFGKCGDLDSCLCQENYASRNCGIRPSLLYLNKGTAMQVDNDKIGYFEADLNDWKENTITINCTYIGERGMIYIGKPTNNIYDLPNSQNYVSWISLNSTSSANILSFDIDISDQRLLFLAVFNNLVDSGRRISIVCQLSKKSSNSESSSISTVVIITIICSIVSVSLAITILCINRRLSRTQVANETQFAVSGINITTVQHSYPAKHLKDLKNKSEDIKLCVICMEDMTPMTEVRKMMCGHIFHATCIDEWFGHHKYCCICKRNCESPDLMMYGGCNHEMGEDARFISEHNSIEPGSREINSNAWSAS